MKLLVLGLLLSSFVYARTGDVSYDYEANFQLEQINQRDPQSLEQENEEKEDTAQERQEMEQ